MDLHHPRLSVVVTPHRHPHELLAARPVPAHRRLARRWPHRTRLRRAVPPMGLLAALLLVRVTVAGA